MFCGMGENVNASRANSEKTDSQKTKHKLHSGEVVGAEGPGPRDRAC